jgi:hypothetical protein
MTKKSTVWVFGQSMGLPFNIDNVSRGWAELISQQLGFECNNLAQSASDNFFIYQSYLQRQSLIDKNDLLFVVWGHPNRKTFVLDRDNPNHIKVFDTSIYFKDNDIEFIRSNNPVTDNANKWAFLAPTPSNNKFYDTWFNDYYSNYEQNVNFQSYYDSVKLTAPCSYVPVYFSKESVEKITVDPTLFYLDFVVDNKCNISDDDYHLNEIGHKLFANSVLPFVTKQLICRSK